MLIWQPLYETQRDDGKGHAAAGTKQCRSIYKGQSSNLADAHEVHGHCWRM